MIADWTSSSNVLFVFFFFFFQLHLLFLVYFFLIYVSFILLGASLGRMMHLSQYLRWECECWPCFSVVKMMSWYHNLCLWKGIHCMILYSFIDVVCTGFSDWWLKDLILAVIGFEWEMIWTAIVPMNGTIIGLPVSKLVYCFSLMVGMLACAVIMALLFDNFIKLKKIFFDAIYLHSNIVSFWKVLFAGVLLHPLDSSPYDLSYSIIVIFFVYSGEVVGQFWDLTDYFLHNIIQKMIVNAILTHFLYIRLFIMVSSSGPPSCYTPTCLPRTVSLVGSAMLRMFWTRQNFIANCSASTKVEDQRISCIICYLRTHFSIGMHCCIFPLSFLWPLSQLPSIQWTRILLHFGRCPNRIPVRPRGRSKHRSKLFRWGWPIGRGSSSYWRFELWHSCRRRGRCIGRSSCLPGWN